MTDVDLNLTWVVAMCLGASIGGTITAWLFSRRQRELVTEIIELRTRLTGCDQNPLTDREQLIARLHIAGLSGKEILQHLADKGDAAAALAARNGESPHHLQPSTPWPKW